HLAEVFGRRAGASTGTCLWGVWSLVAQMRERGETGSIVTLLCDPGELYTSTYYDDDWLAEKGLDPAPYRAQIDSLLDGGPLSARRGLRSARRRLDRYLPVGSVVPGGTDA